MIDLLIKNLPVELPDTGISMLFQRQRTDYVNPTIVRNSFTKTIKLPGTKNNSNIFNNLWKLDCSISNNKFNPSKREPFILLKDGNIIEQGYVKLNNIVWDGHFYSYEITLYGELGNLLYGLSYNINEETDEVSPLTLGDLDFDFNGFSINKELIDTAWKRLDGDSSTEGDEYKMFDTINFMVSYDGVPAADNFDAKSMWCSVDRTAAVEWRDHYYQAQEFPSSVTEDGTTYTYVRTGLTAMDPDDHYGLFDLKREMSTLEARDLRSYLLRPVLNIQKVFEAIGKYINDHFGYTLDMSDPFFSTYDFRSTWMTLSMLYEIDPTVETNTLFTKRLLLSNTSSPASYLISFCKTYGIYLDVDYFAKKLVLTRLPNFFERDKCNELKVDLSREIKITPLSFDKATYTFDYGEGDGQFYKRYKDTYGIQYGSKKVNTGYRFDASTAPYIDNNVFRQAVDSIDQSIYYRYPFGVYNGVLFDYPGPLSDDANLPTYKLFDVQTYRETGEVKTIDGEMKMSWWPTYNNVAHNISNSGYQYLNNWWAGLRPNIWQDGFPKVQFHSDDNKGIDGKDVLVRFSGFRQVSYGRLVSRDDRIYWNNDTYSDSLIDATKVNYLLSDDYPFLKDVLGKNCYYDCPAPALGYSGYSYINVINRLPEFTRGNYIYLLNYSNIPAFYVSSYQSETINGSSNSVSITSTASKFETSVSSSSGRQYPYFTNYALRGGHRYFLAAAVKTANAAVIRNNNSYDFPDIIDSTVIDSLRLSNSDAVQLVASIVETDSSNYNTIVPLSTYDVSSTVSWDTEYLIAFDLTAMGMEDKLTNVDDAIMYFGITEKKVGFPYDLAETLDFGVSREMYVPGCTYESNIGIYNEYWAGYISDLYSINTRVMECYCYLDNIDEVFREFYYYENCLWILSKIVDWNMENKLCKATFIKVNDIDNYANE